MSFIFAQYICYFALISYITPQKPFINLLITYHIDCPQETANESSSAFDKS